MSGQTESEDSKNNVFEKFSCEGNERKSSTWSVALG